MNRPIFKQFAVVIGVIAVSIASAYEIGTGQAGIGVAPALAIVAILALGQPRVRLVYVILGSLFVLQSSRGVSLPKLAYFVGLVICAFYTVASHGLIPASTKAVVRSLSRLSLVVLAVLTIGLVNGLSRSHSGSAIIRDAATYAMLAYLPLFMIDAALAGPRFTRRLLVAAGAIEVFIFTLDWAARRGFAHTPKLGLSSFALVAVLFAYSFARSQSDSRWMVLAGATLASMFATGTRSAIIFLLAPLMVLLPTGDATRRIGRALIGGLVLLVCLGLALQTGFISSASVDRLTGANGDQSLQYSLGAREGLHTAAQALIDHAPLLGNGLGTTFSFTNTFTGAQTQNLLFTDTILTTAARFGWLGLSLLVVVVITATTLPWRRGRRDAAALAAVGLLPVLAGYAVVASPLEDKGLALGLMLLIGVSTSADAQQELTNARPSAAREAEAPERPVRPKGATRAIVNAGDPWPVADAPVRSPSVVVANE